MRDIVLKNLTSKNRAKRILFAKEVINEEGVLTTIRKQLVYIINKVDKVEENVKNTPPEFFIMKEKDTSKLSEVFSIRRKWNMYANLNEQLYLINFLHSLRIRLSPSTAASEK